MPPRIRRGTNRRCHVANMVGYTAALAVLAASGCSSNPPHSDSATDRSEDGHATAGAIVGGAAGAAVGAAGGAVVGGLGAVVLCAPLGILAIACAPVGVVYGGVGGAIQLGKKGAEWGAKAASASPRSMADAPEPTEAAPASETDDAGTYSAALAKSAAQIGKDADRPAADEVTEPHGTVATPAGAAEIDQEPKRTAPESVALAAPIEPAGGPPALFSKGLPKAGTAWIYQVVDRMYGRGTTSLTVEVIRTHENVVEEHVSTGTGATRIATVRRNLDVSAAGIIEQKIGAATTLMDFAPYLLPARGDKAWHDVIEVTGYPQGGGGAAPWVFKAHPPVWEQITVPAGTFRVARLEVEGRRERPAFIRDYITRFVITAWYSLDVKRFARLEHKAWLVDLGNPAGGKLFSHDLLELVSYRPAS